MRWCSRRSRSGANGYLSKESRRAEIVDAVHQVARGRTVVPPELTGGLADQIRLRAQRSGRCSANANIRCCGASLEGKSIPDLAAELDLGASTVKTHT